MQRSPEGGLVVRVTGNEVWVDVEGRTVRCLLRGKLRIKEKGFQLVAGDRVSVTMPERDGEACAIEGIEPRESWLSRYVERETGERMIVANVDELFVVATLLSPPARYEFIDRVLVSAEYGRVRSCVVLNKTDLVDGGDANAFVELYRSCGYDVILSCALSGEGIEPIRSRLGDGIYAFVGESGVGKSSLLMKLDPRLDLKVRSIGPKTGRGRHTTTFSQLYPFGDGYLADTPGIQTFGFPGGTPRDLPACFPEFAGFAENCRFSPCTHSHEPECGVRTAVESGRIPESRHRSYLNILGEVQDREKRKLR